MMTREEILLIEEYCAEHKISHRRRLEEQGKPFWNFYKAKQKYKKADEQDSHPGQFIQLASGRYVPQTLLQKHTTHYKPTYYISHILPFVRHAGYVMRVYQVADFLL